MTLRAGSTCIVFGFACPSNVSPLLTLEAAQGFFLILVGAKVFSVYIYALLDEVISDCGGRDGENGMCKSLEWATSVDGLNPSC